MVLTHKQNLIKLIPYLTTKLAGAGFLLFVMFTYLLFACGFDLFKFVEGISNWSLWIIVFGYGTLCSLLIGLLEFKMPKAKKSVKILLYIVAGYAFFILIEMNVYTLIAGTVGALCPLIFYIGTYVSFRLKPFKYIFSIVVPLFLILLMNVDFTEKEQWNEEKSDFSYIATFEYFNGKHEIPVQAKEGQTITFSMIS